jgi:hypothetical protein
VAAYFAMAAREVAKQFNYLVRSARAKNSNYANCDIRPKAGLEKNLGRTMGYKEPAEALRHPGAPTPASASPVKLP